MNKDNETEVEILSSPATQEMLVADDEEWEEDSSHASSIAVSEQSNHSTRNFATINSATIDKGLVDFRTDEWRRAIKTGPDDASVDITVELYSTICKTLVEICRALRSADSCQTQLRYFNEALNKLHLWGRDLKDGKLGSILSQARGLHEAVLEVLRRLGRLICGNAPDPIESRRALTQSRTIVRW